MDVESAEYKLAEKRVEAKLGFYKNLGAYLIVNISLCIINLITSATISWAIWPILFLGIAIVIHGANTFLQPSGLKEEMIKKELEKVKAKPATKK